MSLGFRTKKTTALFLPLDFKIKIMWQKLKIRWGINSNYQVVVILLIFALTGFSTLYIHRQIDLLLGIDENTVFVIKALIFGILILPIYSLLLFSWGTLLGQRTFFTGFIRAKIQLLFKGTNKI